MSSFLWWVGQIIATLMGGFFLLFGIHLLILAYDLDDPFWFIMTFFASSFMILISAALLAGFIVKMIAAIRGSGENIQ
ncbi:MAG: hypothetical protein KKE57_02095 [Proteobacteria bacterium]|nr:hypothetical protein [Pseudomonadota bacterium]